ncbi:hypothetical protein BDV39DRAFT_216654 [Aspergillus sergii]|uniref:Uncharacterized protein n=1 Tax=Aspergillus sergii TaxID=1034303 RepID=A0A5N6XH32_9EURO|nr:hypothetical protein BDV39DRAFT_216654 [Aspergillus sergii]
MVTRGLWNLHVDGKWYRSFHPPWGSITSPDSPATLKAIRNIISATTFNDWEPVPFPTPLHIDLDYVYNIDKNLGILTITQWSGADDPSLITVEAVLRNVEDFLEQYSTQDDQTQSFAALKVDIGTPSSLNELQFGFFTDFVFLWKIYFDDVASWVGEPLLNTLAIGILRIAAWDFEVLLDTDTEEVPIKFYSVPKCPPDPVENAIQKARAFLDRNQSMRHGARVILISLSHVTLVGISGIFVQRSSTIPLIVNSAAMQPSPGFRMLASILSCSRKRPRARTETWEVNLPLEVFDRILEGLPPKDIISFAQASFAVEEWYYSSLPQLNGLHLRSFDFSIPCCLKQLWPNTDGAHCSLCYPWSHKKCVDRASERLDNEYICSECRQNKTCSILETGGIYGVYRKKKSRSGCKVAINGSTKILNLRLGKPASRRPELWLIRDMPVPPKAINYTIYFNGVFSGLADGLDE